MIKYSSSPVSVAVTAASHALSHLKLMPLCVGVTECATEQHFQHLCDFARFLFIHVRVTGRGWPLARCRAGGAELGGSRGGEVPEGGQRGPARLAAKIAISVL